MKRDIFIFSVVLAVVSTGIWIPAMSAPPPGQSRGKIRPSDRPHQISLERSEYVLLGIDCYGPLGETTCEELGRKAGLDVGEPLPFGWLGGGAAGRIQEYGRWEHVVLSPVFYPDGSVWLAIDVRTSATPTREIPTGRVDLNSDLLRIYESFYGIYVDLSRKGVRVERHVDGGAWNYGDGRLAPYVRVFSLEVPAHRKVLTRMLLSDQRPGHRRAAAGLLAFDLSDPATVDALSMALMDPEPSVRVGAAHALIPKVREATGRGESLVDVDVVIGMLMLPSHSDRAGASALLTEMARLPQLQESIVELAKPILVQMAAGTHPSTRAFARQLLSL